MEHILVIRTHTIEKGQETKIDVVFDSYPEIDKKAIKFQANKIEGATVSKYACVVHTSGSIYNILH